MVVAESLVPGQHFEHAETRGRLVNGDRKLEGHKTGGGCDREGDFRRLNGAKIARTRLWGVNQRLRRWVAAKASA
jgi:hypothetical protein